MAGIKGRSGRKSKSDEQKRLEVIECAWNIVGKFLQSDAKLSEKMPEAIKIVLKSIPSDIFMKTDTRAVTIMPSIKIDKKPFEFNVGNRIMS
jgi:hypothetical protein